MSSKLTRDAYNKLIDEDLAWLRQQPDTLENSHIQMIVAASPVHEYDCYLTREQVDEIRMILVKMSNRTRGIDTDRILAIIDGNESKYVSP